MGSDIIDAWIGNSDKNLNFLFFISYLFKQMIMKYAGFDA